MRTTRRLTIAALLLASCAPAPSAEETLDAAWNRLMDEALVPGLSIAIVTDGAITYAGAFGRKRADEPEEVNTETVFQAASLSKPVFAYLVMKLVDRKVLDLDTPLSMYLPGYLEDDSRLERITARRALSHTTGFPNWRPDGEALRIHFAPGERFSYSGEGYVYLQRVVEQLTGKSLQELAEEEIFTPLGMTRSSYVWRESFESNHAVGHDALGRPRPGDPMLEANAAYSLYTTAADYARFLIAILNGEGLENDSAREMLHPQVQLADCVNCLDNESLERSSELSWGLGWGLQETDGEASFWHWGDQGVFRCYTVSFPARKDALVYFTNSNNGLSVREVIVARAVGGEHPAFSWLEYDAYTSPIKTLERRIARDDIDVGVAYYQKAVAEAPAGSPPFDERSLRGLGRNLLRHGRIADAIEILKLNQQAHPDSSGAHEFLADAYRESEENELARENYRKALELDAQNASAREKLDELEANRPR